MLLEPLVLLVHHYYHLEVLVPLVQYVPALVLLGNLENLVLQCFHLFLGNLEDLSHLVILGYLGLLVPLVPLEALLPLVSLESPVPLELPELQ